MRWRNPKGRNPKAERIPKSKFRTMRSDRGLTVYSYFGLRHSAFFRSSTFEFRIPSLTPFAAALNQAGAMAGSVSESSTIRSAAIFSSSWRRLAVLHETGTLNKARALNSVSPDMAALAHSV